MARGEQHIQTETDGQTGRQAGRHTSKEIPTCTYRYLISINYYVDVFRCYMHYLRIMKA